MFAILGEIEFDLLTSFAGFEMSESVEFAEHNRINLKPRLQFTGKKLKEYSIEIQLHHSFCTPEKNLEAFHVALNQHQPLGLVLGNGKHLGQFVLTQVSVTLQHADAVGNFLAIQCKLSLKEFVGQAPKPTPPAVRKAGKSTGRTVKKSGKAARGKTQTSKQRRATNKAKTADAHGKQAHRQMSSLSEINKREPNTAQAKIPETRKSVQSAQSQMQNSAGVCGARTENQDLQAVGQSHGVAATHYAQADTALAAGDIASADASIQNAEAARQSAQAQLGRQTARNLSRET